MNHSHPSRHEAYVEIFGAQPNHPHHPSHPPPPNFTTFQPQSRPRPRSHSFPGTDQGAYNEAALLMLLRDARNFSGRGGRGRSDGGCRAAARGRGGHSHMRGGFGGHRHAHSQHHFDISPPFPPPHPPHFDNTSEEEPAHHHHRGRDRSEHEHVHRDSPRPEPNHCPSPGFPQSRTHSGSNGRDHGPRYGHYGAPPSPHTQHHQHHHHHGHYMKNQGSPHHGHGGRGKNEGEPDWSIVDSSGPSDSENEKDVLLSPSPTISNASVDVRGAEEMIEREKSKKGAEDGCNLHPIAERLAKLMQSRGDHRGRQYHGSPPQRRSQSPPHHGHDHGHGHGRGHGRGQDDVHECGRRHGHSHVPTHPHTVGQTPPHHGDNHPQHGHHRGRLSANSRGSGRPRGHGPPLYTFEPRHSRREIPFPSFRGPPPFPMQDDDNVFVIPHHSINRQRSRHVRFGSSRANPIVI